MANESLAKLQRRIEQLEAMLNVRTGAAVAPSNDPKDRPDYVERGGDRHAAMLGLKKAENGDIAVDGWALEDVTMFGPQVTDKFLEAYLRQRVNELTSEAPEIQSTDPFAPHFAPTLWKKGNPLSQLTE